MSDATHDKSNSAPEDDAMSSEPSMEDILASIRRIIAEDDEGSAAPQTASDDTDFEHLELMTDTALAEPESRDDTDPGFEALDLTSDEDFEPLDLEIPEIDDASDDEFAVLDAMLEEEGGAASASSPAAFDAAELNMSASADGSDDDDSIFDLVNEAFEDDGTAFQSPLSSGDAPGDSVIDLGFDIGSKKARGFSGAGPAPSKSSAAETPDIGADLSTAQDDELMNSILDFDGDDAADLQVAVDDIEPSSPSKTGPADRIALPDQADDIALVKSLMADLTDDSFMDAEDELTSTLPEASLTEASQEDGQDSDESVFDDILDLTIESEIDAALVPGAGSATKKAEEPAPESEAPPRRSALLDIAQAADEDAKQVETELKTSHGDDDAFELESFEAAESQADEAAGEDDEDIIDFVTNDAEDETTDETDADEAALVDSVLADMTAEDETTETPRGTTPEQTKEQEARVMAEAAKKSDAILDDVTESAAAGAFASLNQMVEEQTVEKEAGPRIGDLVQDALRPMLKEWLDENLRDIVERAVAKEVKRIASGK